MDKPRSTMVFQEMDPDKVWKALEGHQDILTPAMRAHEAHFKNLSCPRCGGAVMAFVDPSCLFRPDGILPKYLARCKTCSAEFEPHTMIEVKGPQRAEEF